jgi:hypothetical protein
MNRAHLQVVQWPTLMATNIQPTDWGWKVSNDRYISILTDLQPAPEEMLNVVRCKCRAGGCSGYESITTTSDVLGGTYLGWSRRSVMRDRWEGMSEAYKGAFSRGMFSWREGTTRVELRLS